MAEHDTARHAEHDLEVVATFAAAEASDLQAEHARRLIATCTECADLARDLQAITSTIRSMPPAERAIGLHAAPRDYRLSPEQATRLRGGSPVRRWLAGVGASLGAFGRPVGASLAAMGIVGLLVGSVSGGAFGGASTAGMSSDSGAGQAPAATFGVAGNQNVPGATSVLDRELQPLATAVAPGEMPTAEDLRAAEPDRDATSRLVVGGSAVLLAGGLVLLLLGARARRRGSDAG